MQKLGYDKILFSGDQSGQVGLQYFLVNTCCFDKINLHFGAFAIDLVAFPKTLLEELQWAYNWPNRSGEATRQDKKGILTGREHQRLAQSQSHHFDIIERYIGPDILILFEGLKGSI
jgi:hypothetical protein